MSGLPSSAARAAAEALPQLWWPSASLFWRALLQWLRSPVKPFAPRCSTCIVSNVYVSLSVLIS